MGVAVVQAREKDGVGEVKIIFLKKRRRSSINIKGNISDE